MINTDRCIFDYGQVICEALTTKCCKGCKFRKTAAEFAAGQIYADDLLKLKGLERTQMREGKNLIMTTKTRGEK